MAEKNEKGSREMRLLKQGRLGLVRVIFSRLGVITLLFLLQAALLATAFMWLEEAIHLYVGATAVVTAVAVLFLLNGDSDPSAKITWLVIIMALPIMGVLLFAYTKTEVGHRALKARTDKLIKESKGILPLSAATLADMEKNAPDTVPLASYLYTTGDWVSYNDSNAIYFSDGESKHGAMLEALEKAEKFIFLEYFIISEGEMWGRTLEILARKAKEGVEVRVLYDGTCQFTRLTADYASRLNKLGIKCRTFSPLTPFVSTHYNYRDHRKIAVIDGKTAFTGGVNLADEYININSRFGRWKDAAVMIEGNAVNSFTLMFLQMWETGGKGTVGKDYFVWQEKHEGGGFIIPYGDHPLDNNKTGERVYMDILNRAREYVYIMTPYLILDATMETAIRFAAERGVDVRIILPGIPDKKGAYALAKTHYAPLLSSGVKIYEYAPGFIHSKVFLADGKEAVVGTINLDYRSFYHHFECAAYMRATSCIEDVRRDFDTTIPLCREVTPATVKAEKLGTKILGFILKVIAPLM